MVRRSIFYRILLAILLITFLAVAGYGVYRLGYIQGSQSASFALNNGGRAAIRPLPLFRGFSYPLLGPVQPMPLFFPFLIPLFWIGLILLIIFTIRTLVHPWSAQPARRTAEGAASRVSSANQGGPEVMEPYDPYHLRDKSARQGSELKVGDAPGSKPPDG